MNVHKPFYRPPCRPGYLSPIIFPYKSIQSHHSQDLNSACAVPVQKIRRFKLALLLVARIIALPLLTPIPFALHTHRRHCLSSFSYRAIIFPYSRHPPLPLSPLLPRLFHHYHCRFTSTPTSTRYLARPDLNPACAVPCKKGALKRFLLAMGTLSPTPYRMYHVPHITNATFLLSCYPSPLLP